ncbi:MAG: DNA-directed RNA polymerase subunit L [Crenarchaeota archaeon]|nr:DNA-directed RNA polymerase subunit L [Thermoproteota archaeon]
MSEKPVLKLLKREGSTVEIELPGEDHTIANLIAKYAIRKPGVTYSSYVISHPLVGSPVIILSTDGSRDPLDVLEEVLRDIVRDAREFRQLLEKALQDGVKCEEGGAASANA